MRWNKTYLLFLIFLAVVLHVVPTSAQYDQTKCQPKKKFWKSKKSDKWLSYKEPKQRKEKKEQAEENQPATKTVVTKKLKQKKNRRDLRYVKRLRAIKKEGKDVASSTKCPH